MSKIKTINFNYYDIAIDEEDADLRIIPFKVDGQHQPLLYLKSKRRRNELVDVTDAVWNEGVRLSIDGAPVEYGERVDWWYDHVSDEYKNMINNGWGTVIGDIAQVVQQSKTWLKAAPYSKRRRNIHKFLQNWLNNPRNHDRRRA